MKAISDEMYWEDVYEMYELASNLVTIESSNDMKFQFMLHAQTKDAMNKWQDLPIPFPDRRWKPSPKPATKLPKTIVDKSKKSKMTPERRERMLYVQKRLREHNELLAKNREEQNSRYYQ